MKISKIVIKDIEIVLSDEEIQEEQIHEQHEHKCQCSKGEDNFLNSLSSVIEVFGETITDYLKNELSGKKKPNEDEVKKNMNDIEPETAKVQEKPIKNEVDTKIILEKPELKEVKEEKVEEKKVEEVKKEQQPEKKENAYEKKLDEQRKKLLKNLNPSSDLNDFINKILNNMPDK
ncbi:hypothetical protein [Oceanirhabdus sp. W0125-5]|uniref:hypothetical protein n=1 Tax=Oceanirhabdus sp. W0125-5 TaxID=2999116 RepID=UPI0022F2F814|nr:hypothetical protein [Oceanirhabdus sp. W0125-5]WBW95981.1 hypothetical protein OW730_20145 [Oceanirhabdus sp. W0125-5]